MGVRPRHGVVIHVCLLTVGVSMGVSVSVSILCLASHLGNEFYLY